MMKTVFFDLETGGLAVTAPIIQIACVAVDPAWTELEVLDKRILFDESVCEPKALQVNHYSAARWVDARREVEVVQDVKVFLERHADAPAVSQRTGRGYTVARVGGHNISGFDIERLSAMFKRHGLFLPIRFSGVLDTLHGASWFFERHPELPRPEGFSQVALAKYFNIDITGAHDALFDVRLCIQLARRLVL
jgi:DNA polymerase III epsilon subunit-like protein